MKFIQLETNQWGFITINTDMITFFTSTSDEEVVIYTVDNRVIHAIADYEEFTMTLQGVDF